MLEPATHEVVVLYCLHETGHVSQSEHAADLCRSLEDLPWDELVAHSCCQEGICTGGPVLALHTFA